MDLPELTEEELVREMMKLDDFECYPLPKSWYKKYNIPVAVPETVPESRQNNYAYKQRKYDLAPIIVNEPKRDKDGNVILVEVRPPEVVDIVVEQKPFDPATTRLVGLEADTIPKLEG